MKSHKNYHVRFIRTYPKILEVIFFFICIQTEVYDLNVFVVTVKNNRKTFDLDGLIYIWENKNTNP